MHVENIFHQTLQTTSWQFDVVRTVHHIAVCIQVDQLDAQILMSLY